MLYLLPLWWWWFRGLCALFRYLGLCEFALNRVELGKHCRVQVNGSKILVVFIFVVHGGSLTIAR